MSISGGTATVQMGPVLRAWRRVGGSPTRPLREADISSIGREVNAGQLVEGAIFRQGSRLRVNATVHRSGGRASIRLGAVSGSSDTIDLLVNRLSAALLAATSGVRIDPRSRLTDSPDAMDAYIAGIRWHSTPELAAHATIRRPTRTDPLPAACRRW